MACRMYASHLSHLVPRLIFNVFPCRDTRMKGTDSAFQRECCDTEEQRQEQNKTGLRGRLNARMKPFKKMPSEKAKLGQKGLQEGFGFIIKRGQKRRL